MMRNNRKDRTVPHVHARGIASRCVRRIRVAQWWNMRCSGYKKGIQQQLKLMGEDKPVFALAAYGLSLTDHYWMQPVSKELCWKNINFLKKFSDELGNLLTDTGKIDVEGHISSFPASSVNGEMKEMGDSRSYPFSYED